MVPRIIFCVVILMGISNTEAIFTYMMLEEIQAEITQLRNLIQTVNNNVVNGVDKNVHTTYDYIKGNFGQLSRSLANIQTKTQNFDNRLAAVEKLLKQMEQRDVTNRNLINTFSAHDSDISSTVLPNEDFNSMKKEIMNKISTVTNSIGKIENEIVKIKEDNKQIKDFHKKSSQNLESLKTDANNNQKLFIKCDKKLENCNSKINNKENEEWKINITKACNGQESDVKKILANAKLLQNKLDQLSQKYDQSIGQNYTLQKEDHSKSELINYIKKTHEDTIKKLNGLSEMTVNLGAKFVSNSDKITNKIQGLNRLDQEIQKIAGSVTDTKRKVELGVNQTLAEVSKHSKAVTACNGQESEVKKSWQTLKFYIIK
uniref:Reticulocyte-binding protein PFD0110w-like isoform X3 n=1 Tax=Diabrotica virgifera virgifera TaxID=50390 RepID=A0A6P7FQP0_DIAVI